MRLGVLALLTLVFLVHHASGFRLAFFPQSIANWTGITVVSTPRGGMVEAVREKFRSGLANPVFVAGLKPGDLLLEVGDATGRGGPVRGLAELGNRLQQIGFGEPWTIVVERSTPDGPLRLVLGVPPLEHPQLRREMVAFNILARVLLPLLTVLAAVIIGFSRPDNSTAYLASLMFLAFPALFGIGLYALPPALRLFSLLYALFGSFFFAFLIMVFFLRFPTPSPIERRVPWLKVLFFGVLLTLALIQGTLGLADQFSFAWSARLTPPDTSGAFDLIINNSLLVLIFMMFGVGIWSLSLNASQARSPADRRRLGLLWLGTNISLVPLGLTVLLQQFFDPVPMIWLLILACTIWIFPLVFVYVVLRHQVFGIKLILRRGLQYALLSRGLLVLGVVLFVALYFLFSAAVVGPLSRAGSAGALLLAAALALALGVGLRAVNRRVMTSIDRRFFRESYNAQRILTALSQAVRDLTAQPDRLLGVLRDKLQEALQPESVAVFLLKSEIGHLQLPEKDEEEWREFFSGREGDDLCCVLYASPLNPASLLPGTYFPARGEVARWVEKAAAEVVETLDIEPDPRFGWRVEGRGWAGGIEAPEERELLECLGARMIVPLATSRGLEGFVALGGKRSEEPFTREDRELLLTVAGQVALALDYAEMIGRMAEQERLRRELEIAKEVQSQLFPQSFPPLATLRYTGACRPAREVGGDYFDFLPLGPATHLGIAAGDITGKGISAALLMANLQATLRSHAPLRNSAVAELVGDINRLLCGSIAPNRFATFFYGVYDDARRELTYVNAGHNPPFVVRPAAEGPGRIVRLTKGGLVIGVFADQVYEQETVVMAPGDLLVVYTDGVTEATNSRGDFYGQERIEALCAANATLSETALRDLILDDLSRFSGEVPQEDDATLIVARVLPPAPA